MPKRLQKELEKIKKRVLSLCAIVEERVRTAKKSVETWDADLAEEIIMKDYEIDEIEVEIEEECLKILALHQPVAVDLRFLIAVIKINNDLERIGDEAANLAKRVENISRRRRLELTFDYSTMAEMVLSMLRMSIDSLVNLDQKLAFQVLSLDNEVDRMYREIYDKVKAAISERPEYVGYMINLNAISRHLERIGDHCTNIAEEVIYLIEGEIVRHAKRDSLKTIQS
ncbi:MAG: phosphate transport system regulatory protein PhoU [Desulfobacteraceae bacterium]|nr:MAG: phosphate transport system regulatory protein PhoU [Desulfobacteraceae bacterium]